MKENGKGHMNFLFSVFYAWQTIKNTCHTVCSSVSRLNAVFSTFKNSYLVKNQNFSNSNYSITRITNILDCSFYRKFYSYWVLSKSLMKSHIILLNYFFNLQYIVQTNKEPNLVHFVNKRLFIIL